MTRLWKVSLGSNNEFEVDAFKRNLLTIDFSITTDISNAKDREAMMTVLQHVLPDAGHNTLRNFSAQLNQFINVIQVGDLVVSPVSSSRTLAIGRISGGYQPHPDTGSPTRPVEWLKKDLPRDTFKQDLLYSFGAFNTVCEIARNDALRRVQEVVQTGRDSGDGVVIRSVRQSPNTSNESVNDAALQENADAMVDLDQIARDQIDRRIASVFTGHDLTKLVAAILEAQGKQVRVSPPGADNGIDILAGSGPLGLESPRVVVQVKSGREMVDQPTLQSLIGTISDTNADFGLLVSWAGFTQPVQRRFNELYFRVRFWGRKEIIDNLYSTYALLPEAIRAELPLRQTWTLVPESDEEV